VPARRVLITGFANFWGPRLAERLAGEGVEAVIGLDDAAPPEGVPDGVVFVEGDLRSSDLSPLLRAAAPDTIVHNALVQFPDRRNSTRAMHDRNVVGTLQLLAACDGLSTLETLVVRGSAAIYGVAADGPAFYGEEHAASGRALRTRFQRDLGDLESYVQAFARRHPEVCCTLLRLQPVLGRTLDTPITRFLRLPVVPTIMGFDPRLQLVHENDSVEALAATVRRPVRGAVNVAGPGAISLSRAMRTLGRVAVPIPHPLYGTVAGPLGFTEDIVRYLRHGRAVDVRRLTGEVGYTPRATEQVLEAVA
jgi:UDP-glucose 4-epimerase